MENAVVFQRLIEAEIDVVTERGWIVGKNAVEWEERIDSLIDKLQWLRGEARTAYFRKGD